MKSMEELNALKGEVEALNRKLAELTEDELAQVTGGGVSDLPQKKEDEHYVMKVISAIGQGYALLR